MRRTIQIEFNELSPSLIDEFIDAGELPNFKRLRDSSEVFVTDASDELSLEPWVQWPTLHTGIPDRDHGIRQLGESHRLRGRGIARELAEAGFKVGVFGSMNLDYGPLNGFVIPDPWNSDSFPHPAELKAFTNFVESAVQESAAHRLDRRSIVPFLGFLTTHGITPRTAMDVLRHLLDERRDNGLKWRRALLLDGMAYDVFRTLVRRHQVAYATFFSNSTAHFQHYFWRDFQPEKFSDPPARDQHSSLGDAILAGYRNNDRLLGRFLSDFPDDRLVFATALSQQPWDTSKCLYRPKDFGKILQLLGIDSSSTVIEPIMANEFCLRFPDHAATDDAVQRFNKTRVGLKQVFKLEQNEPLRVIVGCSIFDLSTDGLTIDLPNGAHASFSDLFHRIHGVRSGRHHPDGCFWIQSKSPRRVEGKAPLTAVAPTILQLFDVNVPTYMKEPPLALGQRVEDPVAEQDQTP